jgi:two-component sensor histidine kinase
VAVPKKNAASMKPNGKRKAGLIALSEWFQDRPVYAYSGSLFVFLLALGLRFAVDGVLPPGFPFLTFFPSVVISTLVFGTGAGIVNGILSFFAAWCFFIPPYYSFSLSGNNWITLVFFGAIVAIDILIIDRMINALHDLESSREEALAFARQRDDLFKELHHRVGNNLTTISSLLNLQLRSVNDPEARAAIGDAARRVRVIADINRLFHDPTKVTQTLDADFVRDLGRKCLDAAGASGGIRLEADVMPLTLERDHFSPVALILTECMNNALEHGFAGGSKGEIMVRLAHGDGHATLTIENDGAPLPEAFVAQDQKSLGLMLIRSFTRQLDGSFNMKATPKTCAVLTFPYPRTDR